MTDYIKQLESKVKDCKNTNTIFDTRKYVLLEDAKEVLNQALNIPVVSKAKRTACRCGHPYSEKDLQYGICNKCYAPTTEY